VRKADPEPPRSRQSSGVATRFPENRMAVVTSAQASPSLWVRTTANAEIIRRRWHSAPSAILSFGGGLLRDFAKKHVRRDLCPHVPGLHFRPGRTRREESAPAVAGVVARFRKNHVPPRPAPVLPRGGVPAQSDPSGGRLPRRQGRCAISQNHVRLDRCPPPSPGRAPARAEPGGRSLPRRRPGLLRNFATGATCTLATVPYSPLLRAGEVGSRSDPGECARPQRPNPVVAATRPVRNCCIATPSGHLIQGTLSRNRPEGRCAISQRSRPPDPRPSSSGCGAPARSGPSTRRLPRREGHCAISQNHVPHDLRPSFPEAVTWAAHPARASPPAGACPGGGSLRNFAKTEATATCVDASPGSWPRPGRTRWKEPAPGGGRVVAEFRKKMSAAANRLLPVTTSSEPVDRSHRT
jgi:hypothetical protein